MADPWQQRPVLYSFSRCPYAIRARLALAVAGLQPGQNLELREVHLAAKPAELLELAPKATVPVLVAGALVLDESLAIMDWALRRRDPEGWLAGWSDRENAAVADLIRENDGIFKHHLDRYRYPDRFSPSGAAAAQSQAEHRSCALVILRRWNQRLELGDWLLGARPSLADAALLPFVRQFRHSDPAGFDAEPQLARLQAWLARFLASSELSAVLEPPWTARSAWRSPRWLYHLALREEWQAAKHEGSYRRSSRARSLEQEGFIHLSYADQVAATAARFYGDAGPVLLLVIDPLRLAAAGLVVREEPAPASAELFPHLYGPLPLQAVLRAEPWRA